MDASKLRDMLKQKQIQRQKQILKQGFEQVRSPRVKQPSRPPPRIKVPSFLLPLVKKRKEKVEKDMFDIFVRTKGKDIRVEGAKTEKEAWSKLFGKLGGTLRAGGFVTDPLGKKVKPKRLPSQFRLGKTDPFRVIERRRYRLDMPSEVSEIMATPKSKKKKRRKINWLK